MRAVLCVCVWSPVLHFISGYIMNMISYIFYIPLENPAAILLHLFPGNHSRQRHWPNSEQSSTSKLDPIPTGRRTAATQTGRTTVTSERQSATLRGGGSDSEAEEGTRGSRSDGFGILCMGEEE